MACRIDDRVMQSVDAVTHSEESPVDCVEAAAHQARLPCKLGGLGLCSASDLADPAWCASFLACWDRMQAWFPIFADVDITTDTHEWFVLLRDTYNGLRERRDDVAVIYDAYKAQLIHYCDGRTVRQRFRPADLAPATALPPFGALFDGTSIKRPSQRQLASVVHHERWLEWVDMAGGIDHRDERGDLLDDREVRRAIDVSQPGAAGWLTMSPTSPPKRLRTDRFVWELQRRLGLYTTASLDVARLMGEEGIAVDNFGDYFTTHGDKSAPHDAAVRVWHDMAQASATSDVVMGDKQKPEDYLDFNSGHVLDIGEPRQGKGGGHRIIEVKCFNQLVRRSAAGPTTAAGATYAFGGCEELLIWQNKGVAAREGSRPWNSAVGDGRVEEHHGCYRDAIHTKRAEFWLAIHSPNGAMNREACKLFNLYKQRARTAKIDRTEYVMAEGELSKRNNFATHWGQRLSAAVVEADAIRALACVDKEARDRRPATRAA